MRPRRAQSLFDQGPAALAALIRADGPALVVFNPTSWPRTRIRARQAALGPDRWPSRTFPSCHAGRDTLMLVKDVPACGYRVLKLAAAGRPAPPAPPAEATPSKAASTASSSIPASGGIVSIRDKEIGPRVGRCKVAVRLNQ